VVQVKDARSISPEAQEALRKRAVQAVLGGMKQTAAARTFGVARGTVDGPIPPGRRSSAEPKTPGSPTGSQAHGRTRSGHSGAY
jgi:transposase